MSGTATHVPVTVDVVAAMFDGGAYLEAFLESLRSQTHRHWRLWVRDDGSADRTLEIVRRAAAEDSRIRLLGEGGPRLGAGMSFDWLVAHVPHDARYIMFADQDDVWLPDKIGTTLAAMQRAERTAPGPILVHTDLTVVDAELRVIDQSFWHYSRVAPEPVSLRRLVVQNVATGATVMINRALKELAGPLPTDAVYHDWWYACVAAAFGRVVAVRTATVLYRQHGRNVVGAKRGDRDRWSQLPGTVRQAVKEWAHLRRELLRAARQAGAFLDRFQERLSGDDRRFLHAYSRMQEGGAFRRKLQVLRLRLRREHGLWRNLGVLLRA
ncbi:MAG: glycosyltransferase family 2 protein [bacterium]